MSFDDLLNYVKNIETCEDPCMICYLGKKEDLHKTSCGHYFHEDCLKGQKKCPYCDKKLSSIKKKGKITLKSNDKCSVILKSGTRKGQECGRTNCHYHK